MKRSYQKSIRVLAIDPSSRGFGFAVIEGKEKRVAWSLKGDAGGKNATCLAKSGSLIEVYGPEAVGIEYCAAQGSRRSQRIRIVHEAINTLALKSNIIGMAFSRIEIMHTFFVGESGTKYAIAKA